MITDKIDGDIARKRNLVTNFGKIADPIADKALTGMAFIGLSIVGDIWWWVTDRGAGPRVERDPAAAVRAQERRDRRGRAAARSRPPSRRVALSVLLLPLPHGESSHDGNFDQFGIPGEVLFYAGQVLPRRGGRDDPVVRLRVLPRRLAAAARAVWQLITIRCPQLHQVSSQHSTRMPG